MAPGEVHDNGEAMTWATIILLAFSINALDTVAAPSLHHVQRFNNYSRHTIGELLSFNLEYRRFIATQRDLHESIEGFRIIIRETDELWAAWDALRDAKCEYYKEPMRRQALGKLLKIIGPEMFLSGEMPPHVPVWRFVEVR